MKSWITLHDVVQLWREKHNGYWPCEYALRPWLSKDDWYEYCKAHPGTFYTSTLREQHDWMHDVVIDLPARPAQYRVG